jgi:hypothetical protein
VARMQPDEAWFVVGLMQKDIVLALRTAAALPAAATADEVLSHMTSDPVHAVA